MSQLSELEELVALTPYLKAAAALEIERELAEKARKRRRAEVAKLWLPGRIAAIIKDKIIMFLDNSTQHIMSEQRRRMFTQRGVRFFSLAVKVAFISILVGFTIKAYDEDQSTKFISITSSSPNYAYCDTVPNAITGTYSLDTDGYWSGSLDFSPGKGIYQFVFNNFEHSLESYKEWMLKAKENIAQVAAGASSRNLAMNLAYLMSWTYLVHDTTPPPSSISVTDLIRFKGDAAYVLDRAAKTASLGSLTKQCFATPSVDYNRATAQFSITYNLGSPTISAGANQQQGSGYLAEASLDRGGCCSQATDEPSLKTSECVLPPSDFGFDPAIDATIFSIKYNAWTLSTAFAINQNILPLGVLGVVATDLTASSKGCYSLNPSCSSFPCPVSGLLYDAAAQTCSIEVLGTRYFIEARMDARYPGMAPVYCLVTQLEGNDAAACFVRVGSQFALPVFNHMGISAVSGDFFNPTQWCQCAVPDLSPLSPSLRAFYTNNPFMTAHLGSFGQQASFFPPTSNYGLSDSASGSGYCNEFDLLHGLVFYSDPTGAKRADVSLSSFLQTIVLPNAKRPDLVNTMASLSAWGVLKTAGNVGKLDAKKSEFTVTSAASAGATQVTVSTTDTTFPYGLIGLHVSWEGGQGNPFAQGTLIKDVSALPPPPPPSTSYRLTLSQPLAAAIPVGGGSPVAKFHVSNFPLGPTQLSDVLGVLGTSPLTLNPTTYPTPNAYSWCNDAINGLGSCVVLAVNTKDTADQRINAENVVAAGGSCSDVFSSPDKAWSSAPAPGAKAKAQAGAAEVPPTSLVQAYYECLNTPSRSLIVAFGSGAGSAGAISSLFVIFCMLTLGKHFLRKDVDTSELLREADEAIAVEAPKHPVLLHATVAVDADPPPDAEDRRHKAGV